VDRGRPTDPLPLLRSAASPHLSLLTPVEVKGDSVNALAGAGGGTLSNFHARRAHRGGVAVLVGGTA
jgi:hypothetical protein